MASGYPILSSYKLQRFDNWVLFEDTDMNIGPLAVLKGSIKNLYDQYDKNGNWTGMLSDEDADTVDMSMVDYLTGNAGL